MPSEQSSQRSLQDDTRGQVGTGGLPVGLTIVVTAAIAYPVYVAYQHWGEPLYATKTVTREATVSYGLLPSMMDAVGPLLLLFMVFVVYYSMKYVPRGGLR